MPAGLNWASPNDRDTSMRPPRRPSLLTKPPAFSMRARSAGNSALCSRVSVMARRLRPVIAHAAQHAPGIACHCPPPISAT